MSIFDKDRTRRKPERLPAATRNKYGEKECINCGAPNGYPYCTSRCADASRRD